MPVKDCIKNYKPALVARFDEMVSSGINEYEAARDIILDEHKLLFDQLNQIKKDAGIKEAKYVQPKKQNTKAVVESVEEKRAKKQADVEKKKEAKKADVEKKGKEREAKKIADKKEKEAKKIKDKADKQAATADKKQKDQQQKKSDNAKKSKDEMISILMKRHGITERAAQKIIAASRAIKNVDLLRDELKKIIKEDKDQQSLKETPKAQAGSVGVGGAKADIEKLEKEKQEALQPLIEEKEQIEKEIEEIEKNDNGSVKQEVETIDDFLKNNNITEQQLKDEENKLKNHLDELGLKLDTEYNFEDIINRIIKNVKGRFLKTVLKGINSLVGNKLKTKFVFSSVRHEDAAGQYFSHDDTIKIYIPNLSLRVFTLNKRGKEYQQETNIVEVFNKVFIHELIHAFTILKIRATETNAKLGLATIMNPSIEKERLNISRSDQKTIDSLNKIFDFLKNNELLKGEYGVSDIVELVTEALSNEGFAEKLKSIELPKELRYKTGNNNVFENIILYISKLVEDLLNLGSAYSDDNALDSIAAIINDFGNSYSESDQQSFMKINKAEERAREYFKYGKSNQSDNLGSETTKLQQLKQKLAEVNKKIDEVTKRFDAQIAQKQSELKVLESNNNQINEVNENAVVEENIEVIPDSNQIKNEEYSDFIDKGIVSEERLNDIANKVKNREPLSDREKAIFSDKTGEINKIIATKAGSVGVGAETSKENLSEVIKDDLADVEGYESILEATKTMEGKEQREMAASANKTFGQAKKDFEQNNNVQVSPYVLKIINGDVVKGVLGDKTYLFDVLTDAFATSEQRGAAGALILAHRISAGNSFMANVFNSARKREKGDGVVKVIFNPAENSSIITAHDDGSIKINAYQIGLRIDDFGGEKRFFSWAEMAMYEEVIHLATFKVATSSEIEQVGRELSVKEKDIVEKIYGKRLEQKNLETDKMEPDYLALGLEYIRQIQQNAMFGTTTELLKSLRRVEPEKRTATKIFYNVPF